jgi:hypothetical protein
MTAPGFTKFDPRAFLESEERRRTAAKPAKPAKVFDRLDPTLATLATLAARRAGSQNPATLVSDGGRAELLAPLFKPMLPANGEPSLEQPCAARRGRVQELDGAFLHFCTVCGRFGAFGYGVHLGSGKLGRWYCAAHRPGNPSAERRADVP